ncbi:transcriptional regulator [Pseudolysinimonas yzui]|uniref:Transcriptional regulator n=2 Tax=Pseudolysinimonas yzui TaxID=2708254 RepID=A0A8J3GTM4_9MICO|nr:transcriptional regulator [Pseudolysinimonas yzui]
MVADDALDGTGSQSALRRSNERLILDTLRTLGPASQATLARNSGLSKSAVNAIVRALAADGVLEVRPGATGRETEVALIGPRGALVALDLGHQRLHGSVISFDQQHRVDEVVDLGREHDASSDVATVSELVERLLEQAGVSRAEVDRVRVGVHAPYDALTRTISPTGILPGWEGSDVEAMLSAALDLPVEVDNDANYAALAEWSWGAGRGSRNLLYVKSSNGIGSGLIINNQVYRGSNGLAGELGHIVVDSRGALCNCGNRGCLSAVASGRALLLELAAAGSPRESLQQVIADAQAGDLACRRIVGEAGRYLGVGLSHAVKLIAPDTIIIGGELAAAGTLLLDSVKAELSANALQSVSGMPRVEPGLRRGDMSILGCVAAVLAGSGYGMSELPTWILTPTGQRVRETV